MATLRPVDRTLHWIASGSPEQVDCGILSWHPCPYRAATVIALTFPVVALAAIEPAPGRRAGEGEGPYLQLILRGVTVINGTGAPANGPVDIVIRGNRIEWIAGVGYPKVPIDPERRPKLEEGRREIDLSGHYVLPGFVDMHGHIGGEEQGTPAEPRS